MSANKVIYYLTPSGKNVIREFILSLQKKQQAKVRRILLLIDEYGLSSAIPHIKKISGTPLWEIRLLGKDNIRIIYVTTSLNSILVLHGFIKKTQKTPPQEIQTAINRYHDWISNH